MAMWRRYVAVLGLAALCACGGGGRGADCLELGGTGPSRVGGGGPDVSIDVVFMDVRDELLQTLALDYPNVAAPVSDPFPNFGGVFVPSVATATSTATVGGAQGATTLIPALRHVGSWLPLVRTTLSGVGSLMSFVQAPGANNQCLAIAAAATLALGVVPDGLNARPFVPDGALATGLGIAYTILDPTAADALMAAINADDPAQLLAAPRVTIFNGQFAGSFLGQARPGVDDLLISQEVFLPNPPLLDDTVLEGITAALQATADRQRGLVELKIRTSPHAALLQVVPPVVVEGEAKLVEIPIMQMGAEHVRILVPDGSTVILGGIKSLSDDGQTGVPLLSKIPYVNRLFRNTPVRDVQSLMLMVTPRIIIQEEE